MSKINLLPIGFGVLSVGYLFVAGCVSLMDSSIPTASRPAVDPPAPAQDALEILIWNIGYAGLGEESDFRADGGRMIRPPSRKIVEKNMAGVAEILDQRPADVILIQEAARSGFMTRGVDVLGALDAALPSHTRFFSSDIATRLTPAPLSLKHGLATFSKVAASDTTIERITEEPGAVMGFVKRRYHVQITNLTVDGRAWSVINIHLSAFDEGADTRRRQLADVLKIADDLYKSGHAVVVGGDWNMRLAETTFAHTTSQDALFWLHDFPHDQLPADWRLVFDADIPTVRTNERPYLAGENYTGVIDGFLMSPNVAADAVEGVDLGFQYTDHQPVRARFRLKD